MQEMDSINHRWGVRHIMTLSMECIQVAIGISQLIHELYVCSTSGEDLHECESVTVWQHVSTGVILVNIFLDFYGICSVLLTS